MSGKPLIVLLMAVACGLVAMVGVQQMLARNQPGGPETTQDVIVAARNLKSEEILKTDMVELKQVPKSQVPPGSFATVKDVEGRSVEIPILVGEPIVDLKLAPKGAPPGLVARIPKGSRAYAIEVNEQTGVSGFVLPGHRVDVLQARNGGVAVSAGSLAADLVLEDVLVLASNQIFANPQDKTIVARTVTLSVTPEQVDTLVAAKSKGPLSLSLRGVNDHAPTKVKVATPEGKPVLVAARDLDPGAVLGPDLVKVGMIPDQHLPSDHIPADRPIAGRKVKYRLVAGEPILDSKLVPERPEVEVAAETGFFKEVGAGMRAFTVEVNATTGVDRSIRPGDRVDLLAHTGEGATRPAGNVPGAGPQSAALAAASPTAEMLAQDLCVLKAAPGDGAAPGAGGAAPVTLEIPVGLLPRLIAARAGGGLTLALRHPDDHGLYIPPQVVGARQKKHQVVINHGLNLPQTYLFGAEITPEQHRDGRYEGPVPGTLAAGPGAVAGQSPRPDDRDDRQD